MTPGGWIFMIVSWGAVSVATAWCFWRVLRSPRHWTRPEEDVARLHHGEFGEPVPPPSGDED
jgi:hypothetical protein